MSFPILSNSDVTLGGQLKSSILIIIIFSNHYIIINSVMTLFPHSESKSRTVKLNNRPCMTIFDGSIDIDSSILDDRMEQLVLEMILSDSCGGHAAAVSVPHDDAHVEASSLQNSIRDNCMLLTVIESITGSIFGGVAHSFKRAPSLETASTVWTTRHQNNFLFSLGTPGVLKNSMPFKLLASNPKVDVNLSNCGFHMGTDLVALCDHPVCMPNQYCTLAPGYSLPPGQTLQNGTLCGSPGTPSYYPQNIEFFSLTVSLE